MIEGIFTAFLTLIIIILILYLAFVSTKYIGKGVRIQNRSRYMKMVDQMPLGQDKQLSIVKIGDIHYLIGITASAINVLAEMKEEELIPVSSENDMSADVPDFKDIINKLGNRKKRNNNGQ